MRKNQIGCDPLKWKLNGWLKIRAKTASDKAEEKISKLESRPHDAFQNTERKDKVIIWKVGLNTWKIKWESPILREQN